MNTTYGLSTTQISLYDICGDEHYIHANLQKDGDIAIEVQNFDGDQVFKETGHIYAWDSLVAFAKMVLSQDEKIQTELGNK